MRIAGRNHLEWHPHGGEVEDIFVDDEHNSFYHQIKMVEEALADGRKEAVRPSPRLQDSLAIMEFLNEWEAHCRG